MNAAAKNTKTLLAEAAALLKTTPGKLAPRLYGMGYRQTCPRCFGSGSYSFNHQHGTMCYGCSWRGEVAADVTPALIARIREDVEAGALDRYLDRVRADQKIAAQRYGLEARVTNGWMESEVYVRLNSGEVDRYCILARFYNAHVGGGAVGDALILIADKHATPEERLEALRRAIVYAAEVEAIRPVVAAHLDRTIKSGLFARRAAEERAALANTRTMPRDEYERTHDALIAQAQADLADIHAPVLYLDDLLAKIAARKGAA